LPLNPYYGRDWFFMFILGVGSVCTGVFDSLAAAFVSEGLYKSVHHASCDEDTYRDAVYILKVLTILLACLDAVGWVIMLARSLCKVPHLINVFSTLVFHVTLVTRTLVAGFFVTSILDKIRDNAAGCTSDSYDVIRAFVLTSFSIAMCVDVRMVFFTMWHPDGIANEDRQKKLCDDGAVENPQTEPSFPRPFNQCKYHQKV